MNSQPEGPPNPSEPTGPTEPTEPSESAPAESARSESVPSESALSEQSPRTGRPRLGRTVTPGVALSVFVLLCALVVQGLTTQRVGVGPVSIHIGADGTATAPPDAGGARPQTAQAQTIAQQAGALPALAFNYQGIELGTNGFTDTLTLCNVSQRGSLITGEMVIGDPEGDGDGRFVGAVGPSGFFSLDVQEPHQEPSADVYQGSIAADGEVAGTFKYDDGTGVSGTWIANPADGVAPLVCTEDS